MRELKPAVRYPLLLAVNALPMGVNLLLWRRGGYFALLFFLPCFCFLVWLNYRHNGAVGYIMMQCAYGVYTLAGGYLSTMLYTRNISNDGMSYSIGQLLTVGQIFVIALSAVIGVIPKLIGQYRSQKNVNE